MKVIYYNWRVKNWVSQTTTDDQNVIDFVYETMDRLEFTNTPENETIEDDWSHLDPYEFYYLKDYRAYKIEL